MLYRLIYISDRIADKSIDMDELLKAARTFNEAHHITGALWADRRVFVQLLEGDRKNISKVFRRICLDDRHDEVEIMDFSPILERFFPDWAMADLEETEDSQLLIRKFSAGEEFLPRSMSADSLTSFLYYLDKKRGLVD